MRAALRISLLVAIATALLAAPAFAGPATRKGERAVRAKLAKRFDRVTSVRCKARPRRASRGRARKLRCTWRAQRRPLPNRLQRCRGAYAARARRGRIRLRRSQRTRCTTALSALAPWFGFNDNAVRAGQISAAEDALLTESAGGGIHRLTFDWRYAEPSPGVYRLESYDRIYAAMIARGIRPLFTLAFAPSWAWDPLTFCSGDCRYPPARNRYAEWRRIAGLIAARYPRALGVEVWNEPNELVFWRSGPNPARYAELLAEAHQGVKQANPAMTVVTGGFSNRRASTGGSVSLPDFLSGVLSGGAAGHFDALGFHVYPENPRLGGVSWAIDTVRGLLRRPPADARPPAPLWVTETGLSTTHPDGRYRVNPDQQASALTGTVRALRKGGAEVVLVHTLIEPPGPPSARETGFGVVRQDGVPKPAFCAVAALTGARPPRGCSP